MVELSRIVSLITLAILPSQLLLLESDLGHHRMADRWLTYRFFMGMLGLNNDGRLQYSAAAGCNTRV